jgi:hypothetical protein
MILCTLCNCDLPNVEDHYAGVVPVMWDARVQRFAEIETRQEAA